MSSSLHERIGEIARDCWDGSRMSFKELASVLEEDGWGNGNPKCAANWVAQAWRYFDKQGDSVTCSAISRAFSRGGIR